MRVALAQIVCEVGNVAANCSTLQRVARQASEEGCDAVVFPEMADTGYDMKAIVEKASTWDSGPLQLLQEMASQLGIWIVCGLSEREQGDVYNAVAVVDRNGKLAARYRKAHLFTAVGEDRFLKRGDSLTLTTIEGMHWGVMVCYDLRFPEMARSLALKGAEVIVVPSAFPFPRVSHWCTLLASRAIENQMYLVGANRAGADGDITFCGSSRVVDPYGVVLASAPEAGEHLIFAEIKKSRVAEIRGSMAVFEDRRRDLYAQE
ncbi:MAG: carbon-nitrogen family hydrolase [Dehalococcoidia bacterium]|nr:carbon-nitrogen family hydrolase [Dehalococcoidia bacterium]